MAMLTTSRLHLREMVEADLDDMAALLADPDVMRYYPRPKTREEAQGWIDWNRRLYREHGFGLWIVTLRANGEFIGDCGLTIQRVDGVDELEVGYHVRADRQRQGFATEAATAVRDLAWKSLGAHRLIAIIDPANEPSQRVARNIGLTLEKRTENEQGLPVLIYAGTPEVAG